MFQFQVPDKYIARRHAAATIGWLTPKLRVLTGKLSAGNIAINPHGIKISPLNDSHLPR